MRYTQGNVDYTIERTGNSKPTWLVSLIDNRPSFMGGYYVIYSEFLHSYLDGLKLVGLLRQIPDIENLSPREIETITNDMKICPICLNKGYYVPTALSGPNEIQKCLECEIFESDELAAVFATLDGLSTPEAWERFCYDERTRLGVRELAYV